MNDPNALLHQAAAWFRLAIQQHVEHAPKQAEGWLTAFANGETRCVVTVEVLPVPEICCSFQVDDRLIVFHRTPLNEKRGPAN